MTQTTLLELDGISLAYDERGSGPAVLLLHAGIADRRMWDDQLAALAERYRVVRCDLPGFGESGMPSGEFAPWRLPVDLLDRLGIERAVVVGCSLGGRTALDLTLDAPARVAALVLVGSGLGGYPLSSALDAAEESIEAALTAGDLDRAAEVDLRAWVDGPRRAPEQVNPSVRARAHAMARHVYEVALASSVQPRPLRLQPPAVERLGEIAVPALVLVGDEDQPDMLAIADLLAAGIAGARKMVLRGTAHLPNMERPAEFNRAVLDFLANLPSWDGGASDAAR